MRRTLSITFVAAAFAAALAGSAAALPAPQAPAPGLAPASDVQNVHWRRGGVRFYVGPAWRWGWGHRHRHHHWRHWRRW
jgi:hypothetical protein